MPQGLDTCLLAGTGVVCCIAVLAFPSVNAWPEIDGDRFTTPNHNGYDNGANGTTPRGGGGGTTALGSGDGATEPWALSYTDCVSRSSVLLAQALWSALVLGVGLCAASAAVSNDGGDCCFGCCCSSRTAAAADGGDAASAAQRQQRQLQRRQRTLRWQVLVFALALLGLWLSGLALWVGISSLASGHWQCTNAPGDPVGLQVGWCAALTLRLCWLVLALVLDWMTAANPNGFGCCRNGIAGCCTSARQCCHFALLAVCLWRAPLCCRGDASQCCGSCYCRSSPNGNYDNVNANAANRGGGGGGGGAEADADEQFHADPFAAAAADDAPPSNGTRRCGCCRTRSGSGGNADGHHRAILLDPSRVDVLIPGPNFHRRHHHHNAVVGGRGGAGAAGAMHNLAAVQPFGAALPPALHYASYGSGGAFAAPFSAVEEPGLRVVIRSSRGSSGASSGLAPSTTAPSSTASSASGLGSPRNQQYSPPPPPARFAGGAIDWSGLASSAAVRDLLANAERRDSHHSRSHSRSAQHRQHHRPAPPAAAPVEPSEDDVIPLTATAPNSEPNSRSGTVTRADSSVDPMTAANPSTSTTTALHDLSL